MYQLLLYLEHFTVTALSMLFILFFLQSPLICFRKQPLCRPYQQYHRHEPALHLRSPGGAAAADVTALPGLRRCPQPVGQAPKEAAWR